MFNHRRDLQFVCRPEQPDVRTALRLVHVLTDQYHEVNVATHYLDRGWTAPVPGRYRDMLVNVGVDQVAMIEMLAGMIARLLEGAPTETVDRIVKANPVVAAVIGGGDLERALEAGVGESAGNPWRRERTSARENLLADFRANAVAERDHQPEHRILRGQTDDADLRLLLTCLVARTDDHRRVSANAVGVLTEEPDERVYR